VAFPIGHPGNYSNNPAHPFNVIVATLESAGADVDANYGLVPIDPDENRYAILVEESAADRVAAQPGAQGPFANPRIEPFGPPGS
jgi:hypothetical protein